MRKIYVAKRSVADTTLRKDHCERSIAERHFAERTSRKGKCVKVVTDKLNRVKNEKQRSNFKLVYLAVKSHDEDM